MVIDEQRINSALGEYTFLAEMFENLISTADNDLAGIASLCILGSSKDTLLLEVIGKVIKIQFSMIFQPPNSLLGQISAFLVQNKNPSLESEDIIYARWFDYQGNIQKSPDGQNTGQHLVQNNYLRKFIYEVIDFLLSSTHMQTNTKND